MAAGFIAELGSVWNSLMRIGQFRFFGALYDCPIAQSRLHFDIVRDQSIRIIAELVGYR
jgi:hypothetical protein